MEIVIFYNKDIRMFIDILLFKLNIKFSQNIAYVQLFLEIQEVCKKKKVFITAIFKMDNQQGPTVQHRELCSTLCNKPKWEENLKKNRYIYMYN